MVLSNGAVNQDIASLSNQNRLVPTFPFQKKMNYEPDARGKAYKK